MRQPLSPTRLSMTVRSRVSGASAWIHLIVVCAMAPGFLGCGRRDADAPLPRSPGAATGARPAPARPQEPRNADERVVKTHTAAATEASAERVAVVIEDSPGTSALARADRACRRDADCTLGFEDRDIERREMCGCRVCASVLMNQETQRRRDNLFAAQCDRRRLPDSTPCPIADCVAPARTACVRGQCELRDSSASD